MRFIVFCAGIAAGFVTAAGGAGAADGIASDWLVHEYIDGMTGEITGISVQSPKVSPAPAHVAYDHYQARISVSCDAEGIRAQLRFNRAVELVNNYNPANLFILSVQHARVKWDSEFGEMTLVQVLGAGFSVHITDRRDTNGMNGVGDYYIISDFLSRLSKASTVTIEVVPTHNLPLIFKFPLKGSGRAIVDLKERCSKAFDRSY